MDQAAECRENTEAVSKGGEGLSPGGGPLSTGEDLFALLQPPYILASSQDVCDMLRSSFH